MLGSAEEEGLVEDVGGGCVQGGGAEGGREVVYCCWLAAQVEAEFCGEEEEVGEGVGVGEGWGAEIGG